MHDIIKKLLFVFFVGMSFLCHSQEGSKNGKTLQHVLLFQWTEGVNAEAKTEVLSLFKGLPEKINGLNSFEILEVTNSSGNFDQILIFEFASEQALESYDQHPDHLKVKTLAPPLISGFASVDYWE